MNFGRHFRAVLKALNLTQVEAAERLGWSQNTVSYYCNLQRPPRRHALAHMCNKLDLCELDLTTDDWPENYPGGEKIIHAVKIAEEHAKYVAPEPWIAWGKQLKAVWKKDVQRRGEIEVFIGHLWPRQADAIIQWLKGS